MSIRGPGHSLGEAHVPSSWAQDDCTCNYLNLACCLEARPASARKMRASGSCSQERTYCNSLAMCTTLSVQINAWHYRPLSCGVTYYATVLQQELTQSFNIKDSAHDSLPMYTHTEQTHAHSHAFAMQWLITILADRRRMEMMARK